MLRNMLDAAGKFKDFTKKTAKTIKEGAENISKKTSESAPKVSEVAKEAKEATKETVKEAKEATKEAGYTIKKHKVKMPKFETGVIDKDEFEKLDISEKAKRNVKDYKAREVLQEDFGKKYDNFFILKKGEKVGGKEVDLEDGEALVFGYDKDRNLYRSERVNMVDKEDKYLFVNKNELYNPGKTSEELKKEAKKQVEKTEKQLQKNVGPHKVFSDNKKKEIINDLNKGYQDGNTIIDSPQEIMDKTTELNRQQIKSMVEDSPDGFGIGGLGMVTGVTALSMIGMNHYNTRPQRRDNRRNNKDLYGGVSGIR